MVSIEDGGGATNVVEDDGGSAGAGDSGVFN